MPIRGYQGKHPRIAPIAYVDDTAVIIGDVTIGAHSSLWPTMVVRGDVNSTCGWVKTPNMESGNPLSFCPLIPFPRCFCKPLECVEKINGTHKPNPLIPLES
jgi:hypothetical protein